MIKLYHKLTTNNSNKIPKEFIFFDTETEDKKLNINEKELIFKIGWLCYFNSENNKEEWFYFNTKEKFWNFVFNKIKNKRKIYLIAHNLPFDFRILKGFKYLSRWTQKKLIFKGATNIFIFTKNNKTLCFIDNMNFFSTSLKDLGKNLGIKKLNINKDNLKIYCKRDVEILLKAWKFLITFIKENNLGNFSITIAGQAFNAFRHKFYKNNIFIHNNIYAINAERLSYKGGRVEAFKIGKFNNKKLYMLDVNSMYPYIMKNYKMPIKLLKYKKTISLENFNKIKNKYSFIGLCKVNIKEPFIPYKNLDNTTIYPIGNFTTYLTTEEIKYCLNKNYLLNIKDLYIYENDYIFKDYVNFFYNLKLKYENEKNNSLRYLTKLFLNSLYGKFGQKIINFENITKINKKDGYFKVYDFNNNTEKEYRVINKVLQVNKGIEEGYNSLVAIPAHITAIARLYLWSLILKANKNNVYYIDTDSLIVNEIGFKNLKNLIGKDIGKLKIEKIDNDLTVYGLKDYKFNNKQKIKGIRKNAIKISENKFIQEKFEGFNGALRNNRLNTVIVSKIEKNLKRDYNKGVINKNGDILPFILDNGKIINNN